MACSTAVKPLAMYSIRNRMKKNTGKIAENAVSQLAAIGQLIRQYRKLFKINANAAAATAVIPRVTRHRIEMGEATLSIGAHHNVISALDRRDLGFEAKSGRVSRLPVRISLADYPQLKQLAWHVQGVDELSPEAHSIYERNKRFLDIGRPSERELIGLLRNAFEGVVT